MKFPNEFIPGLNEEQDEAKEEDEPVKKEDENEKETVTPDEMDLDAQVKAACEEDNETAIDVEMKDKEAPQEPESQPAPLAPASEAELRHLQGLLKYYTDGIKFIKQIEGSIPLLCELLGSNSKAEVVEAIQFFMVAHRFDMECSRVGVFKMVHKGDLQFDE